MMGGNELHKPVVVVVALILNSKATVSVTNSSSLTGDNAKL